MRTPSLDEAAAVLSPREVGARPLEPFLPKSLGGGRWAVPAVAYMSRAPLPDVILAPSGKGWAVEKPAARPQRDGLEYDPVQAGPREALS